MKKKLQRIKLRKCETCQTFHPVKYRGKMFAGCRFNGQVVDAGAKLAIMPKGNCTDYKGAK